MNTSRLFIVDGISSVWKQDLVFYVAHVLVDAVIVRKLTTRNPREQEDFTLLDLEQTDVSTFERVRPEYAYDYGDERYGFHRSRITESLRDYEKVFIIVRNAEIIRQLKKDFKAFRPTSVFVHMDMRLAENRGLGLRNPAVRDSVKQAFSDYLRDPECYDQVIINGGSRNDLFRLLSCLTKKTERRATRSEGIQSEDLFVIISSSTTRRITQIAIALVSTLAVGLGVNLVTSGSLDYWKSITLILDASILMLTILIQLVLVKYWSESS